MNDIRRPTQFFYGFQYASSKEDGAFIVVWKQLSIAVFQHGFSLKIFIVIDEIHLHASGRDRGYFDDQGMIRVIDHQVHA